MRIVTFTRGTPDTTAKVEADSNGKPTWGDAATVVNPWDEYSLEETLIQSKNTGADTSVIAIGGELHMDALKHSIAMGIPNAIRIDGDGLDVTDSISYANLAAAAVEKLGDVKLVIFGKESIDVGTDQHGYQTARKLGWTMLSYVSKILELDLENNRIKVERTVDQGKEVLSASLPAVISVMKGINEPRYPSFIGIRKASKAEIPVWSPADLGVDVSQQVTEIVTYENPPARNIQTEIIDGESTEAKVAKLVDKLFEEKVL